jgi:hypothetical protein
MFRKKILAGFLAAVLLCMGFICGGIALAGEREVPGLTVAERNKLDTFFSNFSEAGLPEFTPGNLSLDAILNFGVEHVLLNTRHSELPSLDARHWGIGTEQVRAAVDKYFGYKLAAGDVRATTRYPLSNDGYYILPKADGEGAVFSQLVTFTDLGEGRYEATLNVYRASPTFTGDVHADPSAWLLGDRQDLPHLVAAYRAEVSLANPEGPTYYLVAYQKQQ